MAKPVQNRAYGLAIASGGNAWKDACCRFGAVESRFDAQGADSYVASQGAGPLHNFTPVGILWLFPNLVRIIPKFF